MTQSVSRSKLEAQVVNDVEGAFNAFATTNYLDAQRTFIATNLDYLSPLTNYWIAVFQLETAVGMDLRR